MIKPVGYIPNEVYSSKNLGPAWMWPLFKVKVR